MKAQLRSAIAGVVVICSLAASPAQADDMRAGGTGAGHGILQRLAEAFRTANPSDRLELIAGLGSTGGISAVQEGVFAFAVSGRPLKSEEKAKGLDSTPFLHTPFVFVTSHRNPVALTGADVIAIHDGRMTRWADGSEIKPILRPRSDSVSTFLTERMTGMQPAMEKLRQRPDVPVAPTDHDAAEAAEKIANSFAAMTLVQYLTEKRHLQLIPLDGVTPSIEQMENEKYWLKTTLHLVTRQQASPAVQRFLAFLRTPAAEKLIREHGAVPAHMRNAAAQ